MKANEQKRREKKQFKRNPVVVVLQLVHFVYGCVEPLEMALTALDAQRNNNNNGEKKYTLC